MKRRFLNSRLDRALAVLVLILIPPLMLANHHRVTIGQERHCRTNLKQLSLGMLQYVRDYDEKFPPARQWAEVLLPYLGSYRQPLLTDPKLRYECPSFNGGYGYALNKNLDGVNEALVTKPSSDVCLFDSTSGRFNASDFGQSLPSVPRHPHGHGIGFIDGHVKFIQQVNFSVTLAKPLPTPLPRVRNQKIGGKL